ncbi:extracellular solute-binding protein [Breznakiella homolactica]|uniref:Extracellular solute-binding protein n=1 Tax=Breznakiella homolactica TaxID=2798577 RepID=A0A7T8BCY1_9SPIR|nr:extracellular solute-binding protein [Breznakiella homolactica]QQO10698.1 extracellular solute-binding protein [Breznakiella homolactica]
MKKVLVLLLVLLPVILFAGGKKEMDDTVTTIQLWHRYSGRTEQAINTVIASFEEQNPNIKIEVTAKPGEYIELLHNLIADIAAGNPPPDLFIGGYELMNYIYSEIHPTVLKDLAPNRREYNNFANKFLPEILRIGEINGDQISIPMRLTNYVLYYNEDLFSAAGLTNADVPRTWDDVIRVGQIIKDRTGKYAIALWKGTANTDVGLIYSNGGQMVSRDRKSVSFSNPQMVEAVSMWQRLNQLGLEPVSTPDEDMVNFMAGEVAMYIETCAMLATLDRSSDFSLGVAEFPAFGSKRKALPAGGGAILSFTKDRQKYNAVWRAIDFFAGQEAMEIITQTGGLCSTKAVVPITPKQEPAYAQLQYMIPPLSWPGGAKGLEIDRMYINKRTEIIRSSMDVAAALRQLEADCNRLLSE